MPHCIHINVATKEITQQELKLGDLKAYYAFVREPLEIGTRLPNGDIVYVDGEGEYRTPRAASFAINGFVFTGSAIVVGLDESDGADVSPTVSVDIVKRLVQFLTA